MKAVIKKVIKYIGIVLIYCLVLGAVEYGSQIILKYEKDSEIDFLFSGVGAVLGFLTVYIITNNKEKIIRDNKIIKLSTAIYASILGAALNLFIDYGIYGTVFRIKSDSSINCSITMAVLSVVIAPVTEEYIFRKCSIDMAKEKRFETVSLIIVSSLLFAVIHNVSNVARFSSLLLAAIVYSVLYLKTKKIMICVCAHFGHNLVSQIGKVERNYAFEIISVKTIQSKVTITLLMIVLMILCYIFIAKNDNKVITNEKTQ